MYKTVCMGIALSISLFATTSDICTEDVKGFIKAYNLGDKALYENNLTQAQTYFEVTRDKGFEALQNCENYTDSIYEYISASEIQINHIEDILNEQY